VNCYPFESFTLEWGATGRDALGKNRFGSLGLGDLVLGLEPTTPPLAIASALLAPRLLPQFFGAQRERLSQLRRRRAAQFLLELFKALRGRLQLLLRRLELTLLRGDQIDETIDTDTSRMHVLSKRRDGVHACYRTETPALRLRQFSRFSRFPAGAHRLKYTPIRAP
jgi:hypothetical protein